MSAAVLEIVVVVFLLWSAGAVLVLAFEPAERRTRTDHAPMREGDR